MNVVNRKPTFASDQDVMMTIIWHQLLDRPRHG